MSDKNKQAIIDFALKELQDAFKNIQVGKNPSISKEFKNILNILNTADEQLKNNKITEEEMNIIVNEIATEVEDKKE